MATFSEKRGGWAMLLALTLSILAVLVGFGFVIAQAYIRWTLNQNFTFLGGNVLEALLVSGFGTLLGLLYLRKV